jgi:hypothetical protein
VHHQVDEYLLHLRVLRQRKPLDYTAHPHLGVVTHVLPHQLVQILTDNEPLVTDPVDDARDQHHVVLPPPTVLRVEYHLHDLL